MRSRTVTAPTSNQARAAGRSRFASAARISSATAASY
jgi:hypothetical protein